MNFNLAKLENGIITEYPLSNNTSLEDTNLVDVIIPYRQITDAYTYTLNTPQLLDGVWTATWVKDEETPQEIIDIRTRNACAGVRVDRDLLIKETQFRVERYNRLDRLGATQIDDIAELDTYIQALADVPSQPGFPFNVIWPTKP